MVAVGMGLGELRILVGRPQWGDLARRFLNIAVTLLLAPYRASTWTVRCGG